MLDLSLLFALLPFILFFGLMLFKKITLLQISLVAMTLVVVIQAIYWKIIPLFLLNSVIKGFFVAFDIFLIVLGAVFFLEVLKNIKVIENISLYLESVSKDYRVQVILLAWFLINFFEGMAGFGTPGAIVAPILVSIGLSPLTAVVISLLGNSSAGVFGAVGTPIRVGFAGLDVASVSGFAVLYNCVGILFPVFMIWIMAKNQKNRLAHFFEVLPFALWSGFIFVVSSIFVVKIGQEFVSIVGSLLAIVLIVISIKLRVFLPKTERKLNNLQVRKMSLPLYKVILPYLLIIILLVLGKTFLGSVQIDFPWGFTYHFNLFNPGIIFIVAGLPLAILWGRRGLVRDSGVKALRSTIDPFLVILAMSTMIQLMVNSGNNTSELPSVLSILTKNLTGSILPFLAPFIGAFGSFLTGSITISNIMFGNIIAQASVLYNLNVAKILALEISGAAIGNSMAISDIMAAEAVVGLKNKTREVLRGVIGAVLVCLSVLGIIGLLSV